MELPEGKSGQQAHLVEKLQKRAELIGAQKTGTWCVNCETYQAVATFSKCIKFPLLCSSRKYPYPPQGWSMEIPKGEGGGGGGGGTRVHSVYIQDMPRF